MKNRCESALLDYVINTLNEIIMEAEQRKNEYVRELQDTERRIQKCEADLKRANRKAEKNKNDQDLQCAADRIAERLRICREHHKRLSVRSVLFSRLTREEYLEAYQCIKQIALHDRSSADLYRFRIEQLQSNEEEKEQ